MVVASFNSVVMCVSFVYYSLHVLFRLMFVLAVVVLLSAC